MYNITKMDSSFSRYSNFSESAAKPAHSILNGYRVHFVHEYTYLGAHLDFLLDFESQAKVTLKISHKIKILSRMRAHISDNQALTIYKTKVVHILIMLIFFVLGHIKEP